MEEQFFTPMPAVNGRISLSPERIQEAALLALGITKQQMEADSRQTHFVDCRRIIAYLISKHTDLSADKISPYVGNRKRSTVAYLIETAEFLNDHKPFADKVFLIEQRLEGSCA